MRKVIFAKGEFYHIYNRGTDKRDIFSCENGMARFLESMIEFNVLEPIGSLYAQSFRKKNQLNTSTAKGEVTDVVDEKLVNIIAYCLNQNHYHFILQQVSDRGIEKFMQRLGTGYTMYFNSKQERSGALFQGRFKAVHINSNAYLLYVSAYVNLNNRVHQLRGSTSKSSWDEYIGKQKGVGICEKEIVLGQFRKPEEYIAFAENSLQGILERRGLLETSLLLE